MSCCPGRGAPIPQLPEPVTITIAGRGLRCVLYVPCVLWVLYGLAATSAPPNRRLQSRPTELFALFVFFVPIPLLPPRPGRPAAPEPPDGVLRLLCLLWPRSLPRA